MKRKRKRSKTSPTPRKRRKTSKKKWIPYDQYIKQKREKENFVNLCSDEEGVINEYQLQKAYNKWYKDKWPLAVASSCPYTSIEGNTTQAIIKRAKEKYKGYQTGYPDYVHHDPRLVIEEDDDYIYMEFIPAEFFEFKHPNGEYDLRPCQKQVKKALERRGHRVHKVTSLSLGKKLTKRHRRGVPLYRGKIKLNKRTLEFKFPKSPPKVELPTSCRPKRRKKKKKRNRKK